MQEENKYMYQADFCCLKFTLKNEFSFVRFSKYINGYHFRMKPEAGCGGKYISDSRIEKA